MKKLNLTCLSKGFGGGTSGICDYESQGKCDDCVEVLSYIADNAGGGCDCKNIFFAFGLSL